MIVNHLPAILASRSISIRELARLTGITYTTIRAVYHGERRSVQLPPVGWSPKPPDRSASERPMPERPARAPRPRPASPRPPARRPRPASKQADDWSVWE